MKTIRSWVPLVLASLLLAACGGGGDDNTIERGAVLSAQLLGKVTIAQVDAGTAASGLQPLSGKAKCDVDLRYVLYMTRDPAGAQATASAGVLVPSGTDPSCTGQRPVVLYAHGTTFTQTKNLANVSSDSEGALLMAMFAAQGLIVVAPNYLGYDRSSLDYHPYVNAEAQAVDMIDGLRAAKAHIAAESSTKTSAQLLITGYSEGGHVAMATHKVIERDYASEFTVTAAGPMSGPYNLVKQGDIVFGPGPIAASATLYNPLLVTGYQRAYGNIYTNLSDVYQAPFDSAGARLFPTDTPIDQLTAQASCRRPAVHETVRHGRTADRRLPRELSDLELPQGGADQHVARLDTQAAGHRGAMRRRAGSIGLLLQHDRHAGRPRIAQLPGAGMGPRESYQSARRHGR
jgi:hypothetical protein